MAPGIKKLLLLAALLAPPGAASVAAAVPDAAPAKARLAVVRARIAALTQRLSEELAQRDALQARLRAADLAVTQARRRLDGLHAAQLAEQRRAAQWRAEEARAQRALDAQRDTLAAEVRAAYLAGGAAPLRLWLRQDDAAAAGRMMTYYGYFARARTARIAKIAEQTARLRALQAQSAATAQKIDALVQDAAREAAALGGARTERATALAQLQRQVNTADQELAQLRRQEQAVEALIADLDRVVQDFPVDSAQPFERMRGQLPWPVAGRLIARFQQPRAAAQSAPRWNGVSIQASRGAKVHAAYFGRVVYADWLQGLGLLLIIAHGGGYMTLYGHAEVLYKSVGDWVAPGDVIAAVSDAEEAPHLYFEIRAGRKPLDPTPWLRGAAP